MTEKIKLTKKQIEQLWNIFQEHQTDLTLSISHDSGIGPTVNVKVQVEKTIDITDVSDW